MWNHKQAVTVDMSQSPDYGIWEALLKAHVKPTLIRGIPVNSVDYAGEAYEIHGSCLSVGQFTERTAVISSVCDDGGCVGDIVCFGTGE